MIHTDNSDTLVHALAEIERLTKEIDGWKADQKENLANQVALQAEINERAEDAHANAILLESARAAGFRLQAERDAIKAANRDLQDWYDAAIADAKRYQWLRQNYDDSHVMLGDNHNCELMMYEELDAAIDKAMGE